MGKIHSRPCLGSAVPAASGSQSTVMEPRRLAVGRKGQRDLGKPVPPGPLLERQRHLDIGPLEQALAIGQNTIYQPLETRRGVVEGGGEPAAPLAHPRKTSPLLP
jgi:hypothetical protein